MNALLENFLDHITLELGLSDNTRVAYAADIERFLDFIHPEIDSLNKVSRKDVLDFLMSEKERNVGTNTISRRLVSIKVFFRYLQQEGFLDQNITEIMDSPRLWRILPETLSPGEVTRLLQIPDTATVKGLRDRAILETFYATGIRVSELVELTLDDLHLDEGYIRCTGKGRKERVIPISNKAIEFVNRYLEEGRPFYAPDESERHLFLTRLKGPFSRKGLWKFIKNISLQGGLMKNISPHTLRHSFASHLLANGAPLRIIQEMLGHVDISTTQIYTHVDSSRLQSVHHKFHPRS